MVKLFTRTFVLTCSVFISSLTAAFSQAQIKGKVVDTNSGDALPGASVKLDGSGISTISNLDGSYTFKNLKPGHYELKASFEGYKKLEHIFVEAKAGHIEIINLQLSPKAENLSTVSVISRAATGSDRNARQLEKNAPVLVNILSSQTMQLLPDLTAGNSLQRISGVTVQRSGSGEARHAIIRGMDMRYNSTTINGIQISSPDPRYSSLPLDIFPSEILERLEVIKTGIPSMEGNFVGGSINMVMKSAPDKFTIIANASTGFSTLFSSSRPFQAFPHGAVSLKAPAEIFGNNYTATQNDFSRANLNFTNKNLPLNSTAGLIIGGRTKDKKLGILFSGAFQNIYRGDNYMFLEPNAQPQVTTDANGKILNNQAVISDLLQRHYSTQTARWALHNKMDYVFNNKNKIALYNMYVRMNEFETRQTYDSVYLNKLSDNLMRSHTLRQSVYNSTLTGDHTLSNVLSLNWSGSYAYAKGAQPDWAEYDYQTGGGKQIVQTMKRTWQRNKDQNESGYLNLYYSPHISNSNTTVSIGGMYRHRDRNNYWLDYSLDPILVNNLPEIWTSFNAANYEFKTSSNNTGTGISALNTANTYTAHENVSAGYAQLKFDFLTNFNFIGGARIEHTSQGYATQMPSASAGKDGTISYTDLLPGATLKYNINRQQSIRASYFRSIIRPEFYELVPTQTIGEVFDIKGNDSLKHTQADNFDLKYEWLPGSADQFSIGTFYKSIYNPIEYSIVRNGGPSAQYFMPQNFGTAHNYGVEAVFTKFFGMFGVSLNYTYTRSRITTTKLYLYKDETTNNITSKLINQTRPLQGQSPNIGNASLIYRNPNIGLDLQLAFTYAGTRITQVSPYYNLDYWQSAQYNLGFSLEKKFAKRFSWYGKFSNLTNTTLRTYIRQAPEQSSSVTLPGQIYSDKTVVGKDNYGVEIQTGIRFKF